MTHGSQSNKFPVIIHKIERKIPESNFTLRGILNLPIAMTLNSGEKVA